ncbi:MAG: hypothetical protein RLZZ543_1704 [Bacteroidota bacterium]|jgi:hypothetical protein
MKIQIKSNIALSDNGFVFNPASGDSFSVNPMGVEIIKHIKAEKSASEIVALLSEQFDADAITIEKDLYDFKQLLLRHQLADKA